MANSREQMTASAELGLPLATGVRLRFVKRLLASALWPFLHHQIAFNRALVEEIGEIRSRLDRIDGDLEHHTSVLVRHEEPLDRHEFLLRNLEPAIVDLQRALDLVHDKVDLGQRQALGRFYDAVEPMEKTIAELGRRVDELGAKPVRD